VNEVVGWLTKEKLEHPFEFRSAYGVEDGEGGGEDQELLPFTNVTSDFVGTLDYIFYESSKFEQLERLNVPTSFRTLNPRGETNGHLLPSDIWPSDHLAIGATFGVVTQQHSQSTTTYSESEEDEEVIPVDTDEKNVDFDGLSLLRKLHSSDQPITSALVPTNLPDQPIASAYVPSNLPDQPIASAYVPSSLSDQPIASAYVPSNLPDQPIASAYVPSNFPNQPITSAYVPSSLSDKSTAFAYVPHNLLNQPIASTYVPPDLPNQSIASAYVPPNLHN